MFMAALFTTSKTRKHISFNTAYCFYLWPTHVGLSRLSLNRSSSEKLSLTRMAKSLYILSPRPAPGTPLLLLLASCHYALAPV